MHILLIILWLIWMPNVWAQSAFSGQCPSTSAAKLVSLQGKLSYLATEQQQWQLADLNDYLCEGSRVRVEANSRASLLLPDGIILRLSQNTILSLNGIANNQSTLLDLLTGFVHFISRTPRHLQITTPIANAGPEGTEFVLGVDDNKAYLSVYEGLVNFFNQQGAIRLTPNQTAITDLGHIPRIQLDIPALDAVKWALYYPNIMPNLKNNVDLQRVIDDFRHNRVEQALKALEAVKAEQRNNDYYKLRGAIYLSVGLVDKAAQDIDGILHAQANDAEALALRALIFVTRNQKDLAFASLQQALAIDEHSVAVLSVQSYIEQARFDLPKALLVAQQAVQFAPTDALVLARLAELQLSLGLIDEAEITIAQALLLDSQIEKIQTVKGYTALFRTDTKLALQAFNQAIALDSAAPLPRLGLGLAEIRAGRLADGRQDLEIAAGLDPANALIRSYLGKAYFEENRAQQAEQQFILAKKYDQKDPTAYFYDAIINLTNNQPITALHNIEQAIDNNHNRAVYRSSLALDKDLAARSAAQGRIYDELSYQQSGLLEGWKSLNADYANYSAHRLLADDYANLPGHEIARVSELLQSQLLQPVNITPIQPNLAETNLFVLNSLGPNNLSFNEFNPLFEYNRTAIQASGIYGGNNTVGDNVQLSGIKDNISYSLGQANFGTDGFRENNFFKQNLYNAFVQNRLTDRLNIQFDYRHEITTNGDLALNFDRHNYQRDITRKSELDIYRIGGHYEFNPQASLVVSSAYRQSNLTQNQVLPDDAQLYFDVFAQPYHGEKTHDIDTIKQNGFNHELQYLYQTSYYSSVSGIGRTDLQLNHTLNQVILPQSAFSKGIDKNINAQFVPNITGLRRSNFYTYNNVRFSQNLTLTLGLSTDLFIERNRDVNVVNPKLGLMWHPSAKTTLRTAIFRTLSVSDYANQTIEPTQVVGFNQFYNDILGSTSWRYGLGLDHKFSEQFASGIEYSHRNVYMPVDTYRAEHTGRAYFNYMPNQMLALGIEYFYEKIDQPVVVLQNNMTDMLPQGLFANVLTHRIPVTMSLFDRSGFSVKLKNSFVQQSGLFQDVNTREVYHGDSSFIVSDLNLSYRLPNRHGMVSFGVNNIFNNQFNYQNTDYNNITLIPSRILFSRLTLVF